MKLLFSLFITGFFLTKNVAAQDNNINVIHMNMDPICQQWKEVYQDTPVLCHTKDPITKMIEIPDTVDPKKKWTLQFYFGFTRANYLPTTLNLKTQRLNVKVHDFKFDERTTASFYNPKNWQQPMDALRWIDEPTNTFTIALESNHNVFFFRAYHPKFLIENRAYAKNPDRTYRVTGEIDNMPVDQLMKTDPSYDEFYTHEPQINLIGIGNTHMQMEFALGYGKKMQFLDLKKWGTLSTTPEASLGVMFGKTKAAFHSNPQNYWEHSSFEDKSRIHGPSFSLSNRIEWNKNKFKIFGDVRYHHAMMTNNIDSQGGQAKYQSKILAATVGIGFNLAQGKK
jgi:hypothetical protein